MELPRIEISGDRNRARLVEQHVLELDANGIDRLIALLAEYRAVMLPPRDGREMPGALALKHDATVVQANAEPGLIELVIRHPGLPPLAVDMTAGDARLLIADLLAAVAAAEAPETPDEAP